MKQFPWRADGNKQLLDSPHKGFNKQCVAMCSGNVWDPAYNAQYIRTWNTTECNGFKREPGHLFNFDLLGFKNLPYSIRAFLQDQQESSVLVEVYTHSKGRKIRHGWIVYRENEILLQVSCYQSYKSNSLIYWFAECIRTVSV